MKRKLLISLTVTLALVSVLAFASARHKNQPVATATNAKPFAGVTTVAPSALIKAAKASANGGFVVTGRIIESKANGEQNTVAFFTRQGDRRGWRLDQYYLKNGEVDFHSRQWCVVNDGAYREKREGGIERVGPCNLYPVDHLAGQPKFDMLGEQTVTNVEDWRTFTLERTVAPDIGVVLRNVKRHKKTGDTFGEVAESISYQAPAKDFLKLP